MTSCGEGTVQDSESRVEQNPDLALGLLGECPRVELMVMAPKGLSVVASAY